MVVPQLLQIQANFLKAVEANDADTIAAMCNGCIPLFRFQLGRAANKHYASAFHCAASQGHVNALELLRYFCCDPVAINSRRSDGETALMAAVSRDSFDCVRILLQNRADPFVADAENRTAICRAALKDNPGILTCILTAAVASEHQFSNYIDVILVEALKIHVKAWQSDCSPSRQFQELIKILGRICREPVCKPSLFRKKIYSRLRILSESSYVCGCALVNVLHTCLELMYDYGSVDLGAMYAPAVVQFCEDDWIGRCFTILIENANHRNRSQVISMTTMHLLTAVFLHLRMDDLLAVLNLGANKTNLRGIQLFYKYLGIYPYFQGQADYPSQLFKRKTGYIWFQFHYSVRQNLKMQIMRFKVSGLITEDELKEECQPRVFTNFKCECDVSDVSSIEEAIEEVRKIWNIQGSKASPWNSPWKPDDNDIRHETNATVLERSSSVPPPEKDDKWLTRCHSFADFTTLPSLNAEAPLLHQSGSWGSLSGTKHDSQFVSNPFNHALEYSSCYIEAVTRILRDMSLAQNPIYPSEPLDALDLKHLDEAPAYLKNDFVEKRAATLIRDLEQSATPGCLSPLVNVSIIERLIRRRTALRTERRQLSSMRFQATFEKLVTLGPEDTIKLRGAREDLIVPKGNIDGSFNIGQRQGSKMVLALLEESGHNPRGIVVKIFGRDETADTAVKRHVDYNALAHLSTADSSVLSYRLFLNDHQFWYIARSVSDWNLDELIDHGRKSRHGETTLWNPHSIFRDCVEGLQFLHSRPTPIYHGNLKPSNILIDAHGTARLTDFGFGKFLTPSHDLHAPCVVSKKMDGRIDYDSRCWKPLEYFTPKSQYGCSSDVQSLALLGYYMMSNGRSHPFVSEGMQLSELRGAIGEQRYHLSRKFVSPEGMQLFREMLSPSVVERPTPDEALDHVYFWSPERKAFFILVTACQPEFQLSLQDEPILPYHLEVINKLKSLDMSPWMQSVPPNDPILDATTRVNISFDNSAFSFIAYAGIFYSREDDEGRLDNILKVLAKFPMGFSNIHAVLKECGWADRQSYLLTKKMQR